MAAEALFLAQQVAGYGRRTKSAESLAMAALIIAQTPHEVGEIPKEFLEGVTVKKHDPKAEANALLAEAKKIDPKGKAVSDIAAKVADLHTENRRSVTGGATTYNTQYIPLNTVWKFPIPAKYIPNATGTCQWSVYCSNSMSTYDTLSMTATTSGANIPITLGKNLSGNAAYLIATFKPPADGKVTVGVKYTGPTFASWGGKSAPFSVCTY